MLRLNQRYLFLASFLLVVITISPGCDPTDAPNDVKSSKDGGLLDENPDSGLVQRDDHTISLFDGQSLAGWEVTNFGGEGECHAADGVLTIEMGYPLSGVTSDLTDLPKGNYEISLDAKRVDGIDFFCGLTFPVNESHCTLIVGGWAGTVVGLSCIDGQDAARNETRTVRKFELDRWYAIKVQFVDDRIRCWIDDEKLIDISIAGREISVRAETLITRPLGICTFETTAAFRNIELRKLSSSKNE